MANRQCFTVILAFLFAIAASPSIAADSWDVPSSWKRAKNEVADNVYRDITNTFYCGCIYESHNDNDGSATIMNFNDCYDWRSHSHKDAACVLDWEHVVPATLTPASGRKCWRKPEEIDECKGKGGRDCCEDHDEEAQRVLFDPHNLVPTVGQINRLRRADRYAELENGNTFGKCLIKDISGKFEPPDCKKGDVARIWFYMRHAHGVEIEPEDEEIFKIWSDLDPVSPWERERERRIFEFSTLRNMYVYGIEPDSSGACAWEPKE